MSDREQDGVLDCVIVGAGPAGLSAAVNLCRMRRNVLVVDDRDGRSLWSQVNHNYLGFPDGLPAAEIRRQGRRQAARYGARFVRGRVVAAERVAAEPRTAGAAATQRDGALFRLRVSDRAGEGAGSRENVARDDELGGLPGDIDGAELAADGALEIEARTVILATGVGDSFPVFPGWDECVGRTLHWCIQCDGYEAIDRAVAVVGHDEEAVETALDLLDFTPRVTLVAGRAAGFEVLVSRLDDLAANGIAAHPCAVAEYPNRDGRIDALVLDDGVRSRIPVEMVFAYRQPVARNELARALGLALDGLGQIVVDTAGQTSLPGVYAAGDATSLHNHQISAAVHEGNEAAAAANYYLYRPVQKAPGDR
jgi:thioredoxin reductase (NADPH)